MSEGIRKILVIRFRRVGDAVISSTLCSSLKRSFPQAEVHYVLNEGIAPLFENHPDIDRLITFSDADQKSFFTYIEKVRKIIWAGKYDLIVDTRSTIKTLWFSLFSLGTKYRIGRKKSYNRWIQNHRIEPVGIDEVSETLRLLNPLDKKFGITFVRDFKLYSSELERSDFEKKMITLGIDTSKPIMVCAVTARLENKVWAKDRMTSVLQRILEKYPSVQLVFNYAGAREKQNARDIFKSLGSPNRVFIDLEAENLRELLALFSFSSFFFGNEGGPRHISQAMNVPSFAIFPPKASKKKWLPNASERFQGIELTDIQPKAAQDATLSFEQKFALMDAESVWNELDKMLQKHIR